MSIAFFFFFCILSLSQFEFLPFVLLEQNLKKLSENIFVEIILFYSYLNNSLATCNPVGSKNIFLWNFRVSAL